MRCGGMAGLLMASAALAACSTTPSTPLPAMRESQILGSEAIGLTPTELGRRLNIQSDGEVYASELREVDGAVIATTTAQDMEFGARCWDNSSDWNFNLGINTTNVTYRDGRVVAVAPAPLRADPFITSRCSATSRGTARTFVEDGGLFALPFAPLALLAVAGVGEAPEDEVSAMAEIIVGAELPPRVVAWMANHRGHARTMPGANAGESEIWFYTSSTAVEDRHFARVLMQGPRVVGIVRSGDSYGGMRCRVLNGRSMLCRLGDWNVDFPASPCNEKAPRSLAGLSNFKLRKSYSAASAASPTKSSSRAPPARSVMRADLPRRSRR